MSTYITETSEDSPSVLLIARPGSFRNSLATFLESKQFHVDQLEPSQLTPSYIRQLSEHFPYSHWHRLIWWAEELYEPMQFFSQVLDFMKSRPEQKIVLGSVLTPFTPVTGESSQVFSDWKNNLRTQDQVLSSFVQEVGSTKLLVGENIQFIQDERKSPLALLLTGQGRGDKSILAWPTPGVELLDLEDFQETVLHFVLEPRSTSVLLQATPKTTSQQEKELYRVAELVEKRTGNTLSIEKHEVAGEPLPFQWRIELVRGKSRGEDAAKVISSLQLLRPIDKKNSQSMGVVVAEQSESESTSKHKKLPDPDPEPTQVASVREASETRPRKKVQVVPITRPMIENRQKKYEKRLQDIHHQKRVAQRLPKLKTQPIHTTNTPHAAQSKKMIDKHLEGEIQRVFGKQRAVQRTARVTTKVKKTLTYAQKNERRQKVLRVFAVLGTVAVFCGVLFATFLIFKNILVTKVSAAVSKEFSRGEKLSQAKDLLFWSKIFGTQVDGYKLILGKESLPVSSLVTVVAKELSEGFETSLQLEDLQHQVVDQFFGRRQDDIFAALLTLSGLVQEEYQNLSLLQTQMQSLTETEERPLSEEVMKQLSNELQEKRKVLATYQQFEQILPKVLAQEQRKTYLLLFQNPQELRPTGGFLQSCALLTIENGVLINHQVMDISKIDQSLNGEITAPNEVAQFLGQSRWLLRDANWSPDFPTTALQIEKFVERGVGKNVDGVIAINAFTLQDLIRSLGPVNLPEYNEVVTDRNLLEKLEFHSELQLDSQHPQEYSTTVLSKFLDQLVGAPAEKVTMLFSELYASLKNGETFVYLDDTDAAATLRSLGWAGELTTPACPAQMSDGECVVDTFMQVESNIGINKTNHYLKRDITHKIAVAPGKISHDREITLTNNSPSNAWPLGAYKTFIRFYVPENSNLESIEVDGVAVAANALATGSERDKAYFGTRLEVPAGKSVVVRVRYSQMISQQKGFAYTFFNQRQAGSGYTSLRIEVNSDPSLKPLRIAPQALVNGSHVLFIPEPDRHSFVGVKFN